MKRLVEEPGGGDVVGGIERHESDANAGLEHLAHRPRIHPDVPFGRVVGFHRPVHVDRPTHDDELVDVVCHVRLQRQSLGDVGQRPQGEQLHRFW